MRPSFVRSMIPPRDIILKVSNQLLRSSEFVSAFILSYIAIFDAQNLNIECISALSGNNLALIINTWLGPSPRLPPRDLGNYF